MFKERLEISEVFKEESKAQPSLVFAKCFLLAFGLLNFRIGPSFLSGRRCDLPLYWFHIHGHYFAISDEN